MKDVYTKKEFFAPNTNRFNMTWREANAQNHRSKKKEVRDRQFAGKNFSQGRRQQDFFNRLNLP